jgi:hypothetical protein
MPWAYIKSNGLFDRQECADDPANRTNARDKCGDGFLVVMEKRELGLHPAIVPIILDLFHDAMVAWSEA